eukprot:ANDGO_03493.mRNA.1 hypothetical protein
MFFVARKLFGSGGRGKRNGDRQQKNRALKQLEKAEGIDCLVWNLPSNLPPFAPNTNNFQLAAQYSTTFGGTSLLVIVNGAIAFEDYPVANGGSMEAAWPLASCTKSFVGPLILFAVQERIIQSLDEPVAWTITEWAQDPFRSRITIRQLLQLVCGLDPGEIGAPLTYSQACQGIVFDTGAVPEPGRTFLYGPSPFQIAGELLSRRLAAANTGLDVAGYFNKLYKDRVGMQITRFRTHEADHQPILSNGLVMNAREFGRFGEWLRRGADGAIQIDLLNQVYVGSQVNPRYGLSFWLPYVNVPGLGQVDWLVCGGAGGQRMYTSRRLGVTIIRQTDIKVVKARKQVMDQQPAPNGKPPKFSDKEFLARILYGASNLP